MNLKFSGNRSLILGGTCELALSLAECMIESSLFPFLTFRDDRGQACIDDRLHLHKGKYASVYLDLGDRSSIDVMFSDMHMDVSMMVDFAQGDYEGLIASADEESVYRFFTENVSCRAVILKRIARMMLKERRGRLVFVSSSAAKSPNPGQGFYSAAKLASEALYKNLGLELGGRGITTLTLRPGYVDAGRGKKYIRAGGEKVLKKVSINRTLTVREVSEAILFFLSDNASGFNAAEITLDGGLTAGK